MKINITDLPGVGKKISFINGEEQMMSMVSHHSGKRDLYFFEDADDDEAVFTFQLSAEETKQIATQMLNASLSSMDYERVERLQIIRKQTVVEWIEVSKYTQLIGKSYKDIKLSAPSGVSVVGVFMDDDFLVNPEENLTLQPNHILMLVGKNEAIFKFSEQFGGDQK